MISVYSSKPPDFQLHLQNDVPPIALPFERHQRAIETWQAGRDCLNSRKLTSLGGRDLCVGDSHTTIIRARGQGRSAPAMKVPGECMRVCPM